jgi:hypothetical protein
VRSLEDSGRASPTQDGYGSGSDPLWRSLRALIAWELAVDLTQIHVDTSLTHELAADQHDLDRVCAAAERALGVPLPRRETWRIGTGRDLLAEIRGRGGAAEEAPLYQAVLRSTRRPRTGTIVRSGYLTGAETDALRDLVGPTAGHGSSLDVAVAGAGEDARRAPLLVLLGQWVRRGIRVTLNGRRLEA